MKFTVKSFENIKQHIWIILAGVVLVGSLFFLFLNLPEKNKNLDLSPAADVAREFPVKIDHMHPFSINPYRNNGVSPRMVLPDQLINLGVVAKGESGWITFKIKNDGESNLVIEGATTTCTCLSAELSSVIIPPGKSSQVLVDYSFDYLEQQSQTIRRGLVFLTNDPQFPEAEVWFQAEIK